MSSESISQEQLTALLLEASNHDQDASTIEAEELIRTLVQQLRPYFAGGKMKGEEI